MTPYKLLTMEKDSRIFVTGHKGLVGSNLIKKLKELGYTNIITAYRGRDKRGGNGVDLIDPVDVNNWLANNQPE